MCLNPPIDLHRNICHICDIFQLRVASRALGGKGLPVRRQARPVRPVRGHILVQGSKFIFDVDEKSDQLVKLQKVVFAARSNMRNNLPC